MISLMFKDFLVVLFTYLNIRLYIIVYRLVIVSSARQSVCLHNPFVQTLAPQVLHR